MRLIHPVYFSQVAREFLCMPPGGSQKTEIAHFRAHFGTSFEVCSELWWRLEPHKTISKDARPDHLLWMLMWAKIYLSEAILARLAGDVDEKMFRKWTWIFLNTAVNLEAEVVRSASCMSSFLNVIFYQWLFILFIQIVWKNWFDDWNGLNKCLVTVVNGTDCRIQEPWPFWKDWRCSMYKLAFL
jgi:hypothetical protein